MVRRMLATLAVVLALSAPVVWANSCFQSPDPLYSRGYETITVSTSAVGFTVPAGTLLAVVMVETDAIRYRDDGTDPTSSLGMPVTSGGSLVVCPNQLSRIRFIRSGANDASLKVSYYGR